MVSSEWDAFEIFLFCTSISSAPLSTSHKVMEYVLNHHTAHWFSLMIIISKFLGFSRQHSVLGSNDTDPVLCYFHEIQNCIFIFRMSDPDSLWQRGVHDKALKRWSNHILTDCWIHSYWFSRLRLFYKHKIKNEAKLHPCFSHLQHLWSVGKTIFGFLLLHLSHPPLPTEKYQEWNLCLWQINVHQERAKQKRNIQKSIN